VRRLYDHVVESGRIFVAADPVLTPLPSDARTLARAPLDVTGAWTLSEPMAALPELDRLCATPGPPIVYVGFGSMVHGDRTRLMRMLREAIARAGVRAVLGSGWSGLTTDDAARASNGGLVLGDVPHAEVFPRMAAVVHHGGAGTFATAARAGVPQVVVSHLGDQHWHGWRVHELGLGPKPIVERVLTAERLAAAIRSAVGDARFAARARKIGEELVGGDGAAAAGAILEREAAVAPAQRR
jgi:sterol 3beta-glucosyltransferase